MTAKTVTPSDVGDTQLRNLYLSAFPAEERIAWPDLLRLIAPMKLDFTAYYDGQQFVGLTIVYPHGDYSWLWYFAVVEQLRGQGYGQRILTHVIDRYRSGRLILDMEAPEQPSDNRAQRLRRLAFYERNGFHDTHAHKTYDGIEYTIMMLGEGSFTAQDYDAVIRDLRRFWWK